jgi:DNA-binding transcriptional ArsR family regulator
MGATHGVTADTAIDARHAQQVARLMSALATASRVRILAHLRQAPRSVGELTAAVQMAQPAVSHQLRILRDLGLVVGTQAGRTTVYALHDMHVATLLDEALRHIEHLASAPPEASGPAGQQPLTSTDK